MARVQPPLTPLLPLLLPLAGVFAAGLCLTALQSLGLLLPLGGDGPTPEHYAAVLGSPAMRRSAAFTLYVSAASALGSVTAGTALGYMAWRLPRRLRQTAVVYKTGLVLPHVAAAFLVLLFFGQTGLLASVANRLGLAPTPQDFPQLLFAGDGLGMILAYMYKGTPFAMLMVLAVLFGFDTRLLQTAAMLGAGPCETFRRVTLPRLLPAMHGAFIILFLYAFGAFDIPFCWASRGRACCPCASTTSTSSRTSPTAAGHGRPDPHVRLHGPLHHALQRPRPPSGRPWEEAVTGGARRHASGGQGTRPLHPVLAGWGKA
jgi:putative spermidine/putrescine transport system permease protein